MNKALSPSLLKKKMEYIRLYLWKDHIRYKAWSIYLAVSDYSFLFIENVAPQV